MQQRQSQRGTQRPTTTSTRGRHSASTSTRSQRANSQRLDTRRANSRQSSSQRSGSHRESTRQPASQRSGSQLSQSRNLDQSSAPARKRITLGKVIGLIVLIALIFFGVRFCSATSSIKVTVNGTPYELRGDKTIQVALKESGLPVNPGDLISLEGNILERHGGDPFFATVNEEETADPNYKLHNGDVVTITDGKDALEPFDAVETSVPCGVSIVGIGPIHTFSEGEEGVMETRTGQISGEVVEKQTKDPKDMTEMRSTPDIGDRKVIALTFDGGPGEPYTAEVLDILKQNNAKATFFFVGENIDIYGPEIVKRASDDGHQICTHSYDDALVAKGEMANLSPEQQIDQLEHGLQVIRDAVGYEPSKFVRLGDKDLEEGSLVVLAPYIDAEIGWTLDTGDWLSMDETQIYDVLMSAKAGDVVRLHDGGGYQDTTVSALKKALPKLVAKGFSFVTIDELLGVETERVSVQTDSQGKAQSE